MGFISHHEIEWQLVGNGVRVVVVHEFCMGDFVSPGGRVRSTKDPQIGFDFLVDLFCFSIRLRVVGSGEGKVIVEEFPEFFGENGGELWTTIRDNLVIESKVEVDLVEKEGGDLFCGDCFLGRAENYPFNKPMIDHDQERVKAKGHRQVSDEVTRDLLEGSRGKGSDRGERWNGGMGIQLILLAGSASFDILPDKLHETRPPEFCYNKLMGFKVTWVASSLMVITLVNSTLSKCIVWGNVNVSLVGEDTLRDLPVRQTGMEGSRDGWF